MVRKCCKVSCRQTYFKGLSLFKVPFYDALGSEKWMNVIRGNETRNKDYFVYEKHFKSSDFEHNGIDVNVKKLKLSAVPSLFLPEIKIVYNESENRNNHIELSFDFEENNLNYDYISYENLPLNITEMSICNENSPIQINHGTPKILFSQMQLMKYTRILSI